MGGTARTTAPIMLLLLASIFSRVTKNGEWLLKQWVICMFNNACIPQWLLHGHVIVARDLIFLFHVRTSNTNKTNALYSQLDADDGKFNDTREPTVKEL